MLEKARSIALIFLYVALGLSVLAIAFSLFYTSFLW
jgi:hypothetical protein